MKKHLLSLIAVAFLAIGICSCGAKSSSDLVDLLNSYADKISECTNVSEVEKLDSELTKELQPYYNDDTELSESEKNEIIEAYTKIGVYELFRLNGNNKSSEEMQGMVDIIVKSNKEDCKDCKTVKELLKTLETL